MDLSRVPSRDSRRISDAPRDAGVLVPVIERDGEHHLLFTERAEHLSEHPGQMSFPGGGREPWDEDIRATALREANEEVGLQASEAEVVGSLDDIQTITDYAVTPFVARVPDREYEANDGEVARVVVLPVARLREPDTYECETREHPNFGEVAIHYFHVDDVTVWGATARILVQLLELTTDWVVPPARPEGCGD